MSALLSQMVETMLYMNLEVSSAFNFGLKPGAAFDSANVAHAQVDQPSGFLAETTPGLGHQRDDGFPSPREQVDVGRTCMTFRCSRTSIASGAPCGWPPITPSCGHLLSSLGE